MNTYSLVDENKDLEELLFSYYNIGRIRNQVSHGVSGVNIYPGQRRLRKENDNVRMLSDAVEHFIQQYDLVKEKIKNKDTTVLTITNEDLRDYMYSRPQK